MPIFWKMKVRERIEIKAQLLISGFVFILNSLSLSASKLIFTQILCFCLCLPSISLKSCNVAGVGCTVSVLGYRVRINSAWVAVSSCSFPLVSLTYSYSLYLFLTKWFPCSCAHTYLILSPKTDEYLRLVFKLVFWDRSLIGWYSVSVDLIG